MVRNALHIKQQLFEAVAIVVLCLPMRMIKRREVNWLAQNSIAG